MIRLVYLLRRLGFGKPKSPAETTEPAQPDYRERITRLVVERLSEDETLRGNLTDDGFAPVLRFVTSLVPGATLRALAEVTPDEAEEIVSRTTRALTRAIVAAAETNDVSIVDEHLTPPIVPPASVERARDAITAGPVPGSSSENRALWIVSVLGAALQEPSP